MHLFEPFPAGHALPARFIHQEVYEVLCHIHHARILIHDDHAAGAHYAPYFLQAVVVHGHVYPAHWDAPAGGPPGLNRLQTLVFLDPPSNVIDDLAKGNAHGNFYQTGISYLTHQGEYLGSLTCGGSNITVPFSPTVNDQRHISQSFHIVYDSRLSPQSLYSRKWRP